MPNRLKRLFSRPNPVNVEAQASAGTARSLAILAQAMESHRFNQEQSLLRIGKSSQYMDELISMLDSVIIAHKVVHPDFTRFILLAESQAAEQTEEGSYRYTQEHMAVITKMSQEYETLNGSYEGFEQDKQKIKEGRERLEEALKKLDLCMVTWTRQVLRNGVPA